MVLKIGTTVQCHSKPANVLMLSSVVPPVQIYIVKIMSDELHSLFAQCEIIRFLAPVLLGD